MPSAVSSSCDKLFQKYTIDEIFLVYLIRKHNLWLLEIGWQSGKNEAMARKNYGFVHRLGWDAEVDINQLSSEEYHHQPSPASSKKPWGVSSWGHKWSHSVTFWEILNLLEQILGSNSLENILLWRLLYFSSDQELIKHEIGFLKIEDYIQLTHLKSYFINIWNSKHSISLVWKNREWFEGENSHFRSTCPTALHIDEWSQAQSIHYLQPERYSEVHNHSPPPDNFERE